MIPLYLNFISLSLTISSLFTAVLGFFLLSIPNKSKATFHLSAAFLYFFGLNLGYLVGFSLYSPLAAYHDWFILIFALLSVTHMIQFLLYFSGVTQSKFPKRLLVVHYIYSIIIVAIWIPETFKREIVFRPDGQFWNFTIGSLEETVSILLLVHILSLLGFGLWRIRVVERAQKKELAYFITGFTFLAITPGIANALYMNKIITKDSFQLVYSLITIHGWFIVFIFFLNTTKEKVSFLTKILSVTFTTYMILLVVVSYAVLKAADQGFQSSHRSLAQQAVQSYTSRPDELQYIYSFTEQIDQKGLVFFRKGVDPDFTDIPEKALNFLQTGMTDHWSESFIRQNTDKNQNYYALYYYDPAQEMVYEVGFDYLKYRRYLHESAMYVVYVLILIILVLIVGLPLFMHGSLTKPINSLITGLRQATRGQYVQLPANESEDEIGYLARSFNEMIITISDSKQKILDYTQNLEQMVKERTDTLKRTQQELITAARRAGMADIASNVLHNVGNVLNSVNINTTYIREMIEEINAPGMLKAKELYEKHGRDPDFFKNADSKGQKLIGYYMLLCNDFLNQRNDMLEVIQQLENKILVISQVVHAQQQYASGPSFKEEIDLCKAIDQMLLIQTDTIKEHQIQIIKECVPVPSINGPRIKLLHILINLFTNAKDAVLTNSPENRKIVIKTEQINDRIELIMTDNGIGFENNLATKLFQHGYTTKESGHGFGLHSCANDIHEMNGTISAESAGLYKGASFTLTFKTVG